MFIHPSAWDPGLYLVHSLLMCTSLLPWRPQTRLSQQHIVPEAELGGEDRPTLSVPFNTGRQDRFSCLHLTNQREMTQGAGVTAFGQG